MKRGMALLVLGTMSGLSTVSATDNGGAAAPGELRPYTASYTVSWHGLNAGTTNFALRQEANGEWTYVSRSQPRGLFQLIPSTAMTLVSRMQIGPDGVRPLLFTATRNGESAAQADVHFDWAGLRATGHVEDQTIDMALRPGVQDDLSVQIALIHALEIEQIPAGISVFDKSGIRDYAYTRVGTETVHTPVGDVATIIYRSQRAHAPRSTRFWCAPEFGFIPVRAEQQREDRVEWTMDLRTIQRN